MALPNSIPLFTIPKVFFYPLFRQCHCHNCQKFIPSILAMPLPQTIFFPSHFRQWHCHNCQFFFFSHHLVFLAPSHTSSTHSGSRYEQKELRQYHCRNSTKVGERKIKSRREKFLIFGNGIAAILSAHSATRVGKKKFGNCGNAIAENKK